jgi:hypothetical protein
MCFERIVERRVSSSGEEVGVKTGKGLANDGAVEYARRELRKRQRAHSEAMVGVMYGEKEMSMEAIG